MGKNKGGIIRGYRLIMPAAVRQLSARYALRKQPVAGTHTNAETRLLSAHYRPLLTHYRPIIDHYKPCWTAARNRLQIQILIAEMTKFSKNRPVITVVERLNATTTVLGLIPGHSGMLSEHVDAAVQQRIIMINNDLIMVYNGLTAT